MGLKANFPDDEIVPDQQSALPRRSGVGLSVEQAREELGFVVQSVFATEAARR